MRPVHLLLVQGEQGILSSLPTLAADAGGAGFAIFSVSSREQALAELQKRRFDCVVIDRSDGPSGDPSIDLRAIAAAAPDAAIVLIDHPTEATYVDALSASVQELIERDGLTTTLFLRAARVALRRKIIQSDLLRAERSVMHSDRLAAIGQLAAGVAHEINNPAAFIMANHAVLHEHVQKLGRAIDAMRTALWDEPDSPLKKKLDQILENPEVDRVLADARDIVSENLDGMRRIASIVRHLRTFSRIEREEVELLSLNEVVNAASNMVYNQIRHRAQLVKELGAIPAIAADRGKMTQVVMNLLLNAAQSIREGSADQHQIRVATSTDGDRVLLAVADTGIGIPEDMQDRIFDPFFTTKEREISSGLGLSLCAEIVRQHGGLIQVTSTVGLGSRFDVVLPIDTGLLPAVPAPQTPRAENVRKLRILIVDDEQFVLRSFRRILDPPHEVVTTSGAAEALMILTRDPRFDAIICDLMMPQIDGPMLFERIKQQFPQLAERVIFCSGGAFTDRAKEFVESLPKHIVLAKPVSAEELRGAVAAIVPLENAPTSDLPPSASKKD